MAKTATKIDRAKLEAAIKSLSDKVTTRQDLWVQSAAAYNKMAGIPAPITFSVVMLRVKEWGLEISAPKGKKGRQAGSTPKAPAEPKLKKLKEEPVVEEPVKRRQQPAEIVSSMAHIPSKSPAERAKDILGYGHARAKSLLWISKDRHCWPGVDWKLVEEGLPALLKKGK